MCYGGRVSRHPGRQKRVSNQTPHTRRPFYLVVTFTVAVPVRELFTVMLPGFDGSENSPWYRPPPLLDKVPINWLVEVMYALSMADPLVLRASILSTLFRESYCAEATDTVSV